MKGFQKKIKHSMLPITLWGVSLLVGLCLFEVCFRGVGEIQGVDYRIFGKQLNVKERTPNRLFYRHTENSLVTLRPNTQALAHTYDYHVVYTTNSWGMRDREYPHSPSPGNHRFLALGDSMTFGEGIPYGKRFTDIAEESIPNAEILNAGVPGYGLGQQWAWMKNLVPVVKPQTVLVFLNFPAIARRHLPLSIKDGFAIPDPHSSSVNLSDYEEVKPLPFFHLSQHFYTTSYLYYLYQAGSLRRRFEGQSSKFWGKWNPGRDSQPPTTPVGPWIRKRSLAILNSIARDCEAWGISLVAINIDPNWKMEWIHSLARKVKFLDLSSPLTDFAKESPLRFKYDRHFNPSTHEFIGKKLSDFLRKSLSSKRVVQNAQ